MKAIHTLLAAAALALSFAGSARASADPAAKAQAAEMTAAEVRKVDNANRKITLRHEAIRNLDMPPMTMVFGVAEAVVLDKVKAGDKVRFRASSDNGKFTVTELQPAN